MKSGKNNKANETKNQTLLPEKSIPITKTGNYTFRINDNVNPGCPPAVKLIRVEKTGKSESSKFKFTELAEARINN